MKKYVSLFIDELKAMTDDTLEAWRLCELARSKQRN